nr:PREDICTED: transmembrane protein 106C isoform X2 [Latimeria chalumnae]|eukprot:XP_014340318.1 PREDICTED: transmembrane protein 106C isoform X2 [Latimeria chalumnae]
MGSPFSTFRGFHCMRQSAREEESLDGIAQREDIARFPYVEFTGRDSITCPTCQGSGLNPTDQVNELVALIPYSDQRLRPQRTDDGIKVVTVWFDKENFKLLVTLTCTLNISNSNFYFVSVDSLTSQVQYMKTVIGTYEVKNVSLIKPRSDKQVNFTGSVEIGGALFYIYTFCSMPTIKVHNIVIFMQIMVKVSYIFHAGQNLLETYKYIDCGGNNTLYQKPPSLSGDR